MDTNERMLRVRVAMTFAIDGDLRFVSHRDSLRLFERAMIRAGWPIKYSEGFNPHPRIWLLSARPVGVSGENEMLMVELTEAVDVDQARNRLAEQVPMGIVLGQSMVVHGKRLPQPQRISYRLSVPPEDQEKVLQALERINQSPSCHIQRNHGPKKKSSVVDIRPQLEAIALADGELRFVVGVTGKGSIKPGEVLEALGLPSEQLADLRRFDIVWQWSDEPGAMQHPMEQ